MACRIDRKRDTSPISSAQVSAVMGPTPGTVLRRLILSHSKGSRCRELTRAYSIFCSRTMVSRLSLSKGRILFWESYERNAERARDHQGTHGSPRRTEDPEGRIASGQTPWRSEPSRLCSSQCRLQ